MEFKLQTARHDILCSAATASRETKSEYAKWLHDLISEDSVRNHSGSNKNLEGTSRVQLILAVFGSGGLKNISSEL